MSFGTSSFQNRIKRILFKVNSCVPLEECGMTIWEMVQQIGAKNTKFCLSLLSVSYLIPRLLMQIPLK